MTTPSWGKTETEPLILNFSQGPPDIEVIDSEERLLEVFGRPDFKFKQTYADADLKNSPYWKLVPIRVIAGEGIGQVLYIEDIDAYDPDELLDIFDDPSYSDVSF